MVGFDASNRNILDAKYICSVCSLILRQPLQLKTCGHRLCQSCLNNQNQTSIRCAECQIETSLDQIMFDRGSHKDMQSLPILCSHCDWNGTLENYQEHLDQAHTNVMCQYCQQMFSTVSQLNEHQASQCEKVTVDCLLKNFGCQQPILRSELSTHYSSQQHQDSVMRAVEMVKSQLGASQSMVNQMDTDNPQTTMTMSTAGGISQLEELVHALSILEGGIQSLTESADLLNDEELERLRKLEDLMGSARRVKASIEEDGALLQGNFQNLEFLQQRLASVEEEINDFEHASHDGTFTWKISNVKEKLRDSQSERQTSIYSPPFYSSPVGYKMRLRLYLNGDGNARGTHMSLFFVLMRGLNDAILKFPFNYKVTFCLYDQSPQLRHIIDSFRPDIKSNSFQRPRSEMNIASGIPKFFPLSMAQQQDNSYVKDDTMFIKVVVDFSNTPKLLVPYAMSLNPGLPSEVQQAMIRAEADRRVQQQTTN